MGLYNDEFEGQGGSYIVDPKTGKRTRVENAEPVPAPERKPAKPAVKPTEPELKSEE